MEDEFHYKQNQILESVLKAAEENGFKVITKVCHFPNNDVYNFIRELNGFEEESRKVRYVARYSFA